MNRSLPSLGDALAKGITASAASGGGLDVDVIHAMEERDLALIADEVLHGSMSSAFVYNFKVAGKDVQGVSIVGAKHLAFHYQGMKHRIIASMDKRGALMTFRSYDPLDIRVQRVPELEQEPDFYECVIEVTDTKTGNSRQTVRIENRWERRSDGSSYERPNYAVIAQSKAYRNAVLSLVPQDVMLEFKAQCVAQGKSVDLSDDVLAQRRSGVLEFAATRGIALERQEVEKLTFEQITGLRKAVDEGVDVFAEALVGLGLAKADGPKTPATGKRSKTAKPKVGASKASDADKRAAAQESTDTPERADSDKPTGETKPAPDSGGPFKE